MSTEPDDRRERAKRTRGYLDSVVRRMLEADARLGIEAHRAGTAPGEALAFEIGRRTLDNAAASYGLDAATLMRETEERATLQTEALLSALGVQLEGNWLELVRGSCAGGMLTGIRIGLMLAELDAQEQAA